MTNDIPTPDAHAQRWRLVSREANTGKTWIDASDRVPALLLVRDPRQEWWAIASECQHCGESLIGALKHSASSEGLDEVICSRCKTVHGHTVPGCKCAALMVVDEEIYAAPE